MAKLVPVKKVPIGKSISSGKNVPQHKTKIIRPPDVSRGAGDKYGGDGKDWDDLLQIPGVKRNTN